MTSPGWHRRLLPGALSWAVVLVATAPAASETFRQEVINPDPSVSLHAEATLYVRLPQSGRPCSAVAVGPHVLITAAHCVENGEATILTPAKKTGDCWTPCSPSAKPSSCSDPPPSAVADIAACFFDEAFEKGIETVSTDVSWLTKGTEVLLTGFGCVGVTKCEPTTWETPAQAGPAEILDDASIQDLFFLTLGDLAKGGSALCFGDSGGPVYRVTQGGRRVVGIAQGGCVDGKPEKSAITSLAAEATVEWLCKWVKKEPKKRAIQGLSCP